MGKFGKELIESMQQAARHAAGKRVRGLRVSKVELPNVKAIRLGLKMSQHHFAAAYRIPLPTLKNWERRRCPMLLLLLTCWRSSDVRKRSWKPSRGHDVARRRIMRSGLPHK